MDTLFAMRKRSLKSQKSEQFTSSPVMEHRKESVTRGRKPRHTRDQIARVAVRVADDEGIQAVSMRRVASEMNSGTASLYRYLTKKDELFDLMVDCVRGQELLPKVSGDWRSDLRNVAHSTRAVVLRHPWLTKVSPVRTALGVNSLRWWEFRLQILDGLGLDIDEMIVWINTLDNFVKGYAVAEIAELEEARSSGIEHERWLNNHAAYVLSVVASGEFPLFNRVVRDAKAPHDPKRWDHEFVLSIEHILDGFAASIAGKPPASKSRRSAVQLGPKNTARRAVDEKEKRKP